MFLARHAALIGKLAAVICFAVMVLGLVSNEIKPHWLSIAGAWYGLIGCCLCVWGVGRLEKLEDKQ